MRTTQRTDFIRYHQHIKHTTFVRHRVTPSSLAPVCHNINIHITHFTHKITPSIVALQTSSLPHHTTSPILSL
jgi:hypothetical protein